MRLVRERFGFLTLIHSMRAFLKLVKSGQGEASIRRWVDEMQHYLPAASMDVSIKQKLLKESIDRDIAPALMMAAAGGKFFVAVRLPHAWRRFLKSKGVRLHPVSLALWPVEVLQRFRQGLRTYRTLMANRQEPEIVPHAVLYGIHDTSFTATLAGKEAQDFLSWSRAFFSLPKEWVVPFSGRILPPTSRTAVTPLPFPGLSFSACAEFSRAAKKEILRALMGICAGRWQRAYMLSDRIEAAYAAQVPREHLAKIYAFTNAAYIYRPLWTYEVERRGAEVAMCFYAMNTFDMRLAAGGDIGYAPGYAAMTWPVIYTQHENHREFLKGVVEAKTDIRVCGLMPYEDNGASADLSGKVKILYLDVQPFRPAFMAGIGRPCHIYTEDVSERTFREVCGAAGKAGAALYIKPKRFVGNRLSIPYRRMLEDAEKAGLARIVDSGISARRLCAVADIVLCQPFTSAALFAAEAGKPVAYYDAPGLFTKSQPASYGVPVLRGYTELEQWIAEAMHVSEAAA
ncbi:MAG TPA: hypothetical protein DEA55_03195 [Rhodospirillaceae bacterium]|nr:hypothetical protein [Rhodospirillaceae bacterium]